VVDQRWGPKICISNSFSGEPNVAGRRTTL
jgi:hypothetical protein